MTLKQRVRFTGIQWSQGKSARYSWLGKEFFKRWTMYEAQDDGVDSTRCNADLGFLDFVGRCFR